MINRCKFAYKSSTIPIDLPLHKAITQKLEELGAFRDVEE